MKTFAEIIDRVAADLENGILHAVDEVLADS